MTADFSVADFDNDENDEEEDEAPTLISLPLPSRLSEPDAPPPDASLPPCPVTVLTGFLGSGKTTLVNYILREPHGKRIAVIENEFGDGLSVESMIARDGVDLSGGSLMDLVELPNGCLCCTVKDSLVATLEQLVTAKRHDLDYILIECSGMANPGPIASLFWLDDALESRLKLDGIVCLVDAKHVAMQLRDTAEAAQQIAYADRILLNKVDLLRGTDGDESGGSGNEALLKRIRHQIQRINPTAPIRTTTHARVDLDWILDANCFDADRVQDVHLSVEAAAEGAVVHHHHHHHDHSHDYGDDPCPTCHAAFESQHRHTASVASFSLVSHGSIHLRLLNQWLADILWPNQDETDKVLRERLQLDHNRATAAVLCPPESSSANAAHGLDPPPAGDGHSARTRAEPQIFRIKGIVSVVHGAGVDRGVGDGESEQYFHPDHVSSDDLVDDRPFVVQAVHDLWTVRPAKDRWDDLKEERQPRQCKLVVIGRHLDRRRLEDGFRACFPVL